MSDSPYYRSVQQMHGSFRTHFLLNFVGFGLGLHFYIACTIINEYFLENRVLAEGVVGGGVGLGTFLFSILQQFLSNNFTWKVSNVQRNMISRVKSLLQY